MWTWTRSRRRGVGLPLKPLLLLLLQLLAGQLHGAVDASSPSELLGSAQRGDATAWVQTRACPDGCTTHGTCHAELGRCDCPKHVGGPACSETLDDSSLWRRCNASLFPSLPSCISSAITCLNACNRRGKCVAGWCHCEPGYYGADCSLSTGSDGRPELLAGLGYKTRRTRPWVYIYELPPHLHSWFNPGRLDRHLHNYMYQRLLSSGARTADGNKADWYYVPIRVRSGGDSWAVIEAFKYITQHFPWFNRTNGDRHFLLHTGDLGASELLPGARQWAPMATWLTHWGLTQRVEGIPGWDMAHRPGRDIVIPVYVAPRHFKHFGMHRSPLHPRHPALQPPRNLTLYFAGRICGSREAPSEAPPTCSPRIGPNYSKGVRAKVWAAHHRRPGFRVVTSDKDHYGTFLRRSRFCLAPLGGGHGQRQILVSFMGCVPVCIADNVLDPFEPELDWSRFAVKPKEEDIPRLGEMLEGVSDADYVQMQAALRCAAQHFVYSSITGGFMGEDGRYDAFETILQILRVRAKHPAAQPHQYQQLDAEFRAFANCQYPDQGAVAVGGAASAPSSGGQRDMFPPSQPPFADSGGVLCSFSAFDGRPPPCMPNLRNPGRILGVPGGTICAKSQDNLAQCPRLWE